MKFSAEIIFRLGDGLTKQLVVERSEKMKKGSVSNFHVDNASRLIDELTVDRNKLERASYILYNF